MNTSQILLVFGMVVPTGERLLHFKFQTLDRTHQELKPPLNKQAPSGADLRYCGLALKDEVCHLSSTVTSQIRADRGGSQVDKAFQWRLQFQLFFTTNLPCLECSTYLPHIKNVNNYPPTLPWEALEKQEVLLLLGYVAVFLEGWPAPRPRMAGRAWWFVFLFAVLPRL